MSFNIEDIQKLERAADIFLGDPAKVTAVERREAESYFDLLQKSNLTLEQCLYIFEHTSSPFLLFQVTKCVSLAVFRDWNSLSDSTIHSTYEFLLKFAVEHPSLPGFAVAELLKCSSRIFKRGILDDEKVNSMERMYSLIRDLITCSNEQYRVLGCQIIEALASEFATSWGGSKYGLTWDFHVRAKRKFEISGLKELFSLSLKILGDLCTFDVDAHPDYSAHDADTHLRLAEHFLRIASLILSWNFSPKIMKNSTHYHSESQHCDVAFRPPEEWKDIIQNPDLLPLFFKFHAKVRVNESLSTTSMHCISQLASIMGESMFGTATQPDYSQFHDQYLGNYVLMFQEIFEHNPSQAEIVFVTTAIFKLHSHHPLPIFFRLRQELLRGWVIHISRKTIDYTAIAVNGFLEDPNHEGFEALKYMYQTWSTIVQSKSTYYKKLAIPQGSIGFIDLLTKDILTELIRCIQHHVDVPVDEELYNDEDHEDDIVLLFDHLRHIGTFVNGCPEVTMDLLDMCVLDKVQHLPGVYNSHDWDALRLWQERTHLFLLIAGYGLTTDQSGLFIPRKSSNSVWNAPTAAML